METAAATPAEIYRIRAPAALKFGQLTALGQDIVHQPLNLALDPRHAGHRPDALDHVKIRD